MKPHEFGAFNNKFDIRFSVPSSYEEFDNTVGEVGAALEEGNTNIILRHTAPRFYKAVSKDLAEKKSFPRNQATNSDGTPMVRPTKTKGDQPIFENETAHIARYYEGGAPEVQNSFESYLQSIADTVSFYDPREASAPRGSSRVNKGHLDAANTLVTQGPEKVERVVAYIESQVAGFIAVREDDGTVSPENLARAIAALEKHEAAKVKAATAAALGALQ